MLMSVERFKPEYFVQLLLTGKKKSVSPPLNYTNDRQYSEYWTQIEKNLLRVFPMLWGEDKGAFGCNCCGETISSVVNLKKHKYFPQPRQNNQRQHTSLPIKIIKRGPGSQSHRHSSGGRQVSWRSYSLEDSASLKSFPEPTWSTWEWRYGWLRWRWGWSWWRCWSLRYTSVTPPYASSSIRPPCRVSRGQISPPLSTSLPTWCVLGEIQSLEIRENVAVLSASCFCFFFSTNPSSLLALLLLKVASAKSLSSFTSLLSCLLAISYSSSGPSSVV